MNLDDVQLSKRRRQDNVTANVRRQARNPRASSHQETRARLGTNRLKPGIVFYGAAAQSPRVELPPEPRPRPASPGFVLLAPQLRIVICSRQDWWVVPVAGASAGDD